jgi:glucose-1-phosphate adenylyltransferase
MDMPSLNEVLAVILGGGRGTRLYPLTKERSKPAVPIAGKYRLIDIPISNCINSSIYRVAVLTQFNSVSLHRHITRTYNFDVFHPGWVQIWAAEQTLESADWYQGTADAVRKQLFEIRTTGAKYILILAGDHLYRMDYTAMAVEHWKNNADITVAVQPAPASEAPRLGILKQDASGRITQFAEKPQTPAELEKLVSRDDPARPYLGSMGIYLFNTDVLFHLLGQSGYEDFGRDIIPHAIQTHAVFGYEYNGYWEDIGTIRSFFETNLKLASSNPPFNFYDPVRPIYTHARFLPGTLVEQSNLNNVLLGEGGHIYQADIHDSIIGIRSQIRSGVKISNSILMGADYYDDLNSLAEGDIPLGIGCNSEINGAIIDKNARFGEGVIIRPFPMGTEMDGQDYVVRDGIVAIPKNTTLPAGTYIGPE